MRLLIKTILTPFVFSAFMLLSLAIVICFIADIIGVLLVNDDFGFIDKFEKYI